jgi:hypothetical protein
MRPTRPTGLVPIDTHALNVSTHHGLGLQGIPLPSAPSTPSQAGPVLPSRTVPQAIWARAEGRRMKSTSVSEFLTSPPAGSAGYLRSGIPLLTASKVSTAGTSGSGALMHPG